VNTRPLVHIGYHKTASTWLQEAVLPFAREATLAPRDTAIRVLLEPNALTFDADAARRRLQADNRLIVSLEGLSGYLHNGGMHGALSRDIARRLKAVLPDADIVVLIRRQPAILAASYAQYVRYGGTHSPERYLFPERFKSLKHTRRDKNPRFDLDHFAYLPLLRLYRDLFGRDRVHVYLYEAFKGGPRAFLQDFCGRHELDIDTAAPGPGTPPRNRSLPPAALSVVRRINLFTAGRVLDKTHLAHLPGAFWLGRGVGRLLTGMLAGDRGSDLGRLMPAARVREIERRYAAGNRALAQEFDLPLERYGYPLESDARSAAADDASHAPQGALP